MAKGICLILLGKKAKDLISRVQQLEEFGKETLKAMERLEAVERELVRIITEAKEQQKDSGPVISVQSEEGEPWIKKSPVTP